MNKLAIAIIFMCAILISACTGNVVYEDSITNHVKIGVLAPLSGFRSDAGAYCQQGISIALTDIEDADPNYTFEIIYEDTKYETKTAVDTFNKIKSIDGINYVIGPYSSPEVLAIGPLAEQSGIILISPTVQSSEVSSLGDYIFRVQINVKHEAPYLASYLNNVTDNLSVLAINTDYSTSFLAEFKKHYTGEIISEQFFLGPETDYKTYLLKIKSEGAKNILLLAGTRNAGNILKQATEMNLDIRFYGTSPLEGQELLNIAGDSANGLIYPYPFDDNSDIESMHDYRNKYFAKYNATPEMISANCYDALLILHKCIEINGDNPVRVKDCLYTIDEYPGASGILTMDENGDVIKPLFLKIIKDGKFVKLE